MDTNTQFTEIHDNGATNPQLSGKENNKFRYNGEENITGIPTRNELVTENNNGLTAILQQALAKRQDIPFMPIDIEETNEYINQIPHYVLRLYGTLINGQKAMICITDIQLFFDILVPRNETPETFEIKIRDILSSVKEIKRFKIEHIKAFPFLGYHVGKESYLRVFTTTTKQRKKAINIVRKNNYSTASDDESTYYRKASREYGFSLSGWSMISNYRCAENFNLCSYVFRVSVKNFQPIEDFSSLNICFPISSLTQDNTLVLTWDIETYSSRKTGEVPRAEYTEDNVFMICMTIHWKDNPKPLKQICLVDVETIPDPDWVTIICGNQTNLLKAFALCWKAFAPDIQLGFNDSDYDWPFIIEKAKTLGILEWMWEQMSGNSRQRTVNEILRWDYYGRLGENNNNAFYNQHKPAKQENMDFDSADGEVENFKRESINIKISAEQKFVSTFLKIPGCVPIDVRPSFMKLYPRSEVEKASSLKFYLEKCKLKSKIDMPISIMNKIYENRNAVEMRRVAEYCIKDALSCQELMVARNVINEYREVGLIAYVSLFDTHYRANGMKVRNLVGAYAFKRNTLFSTICSKNIEKGKFPGAYVFQPIKGIENKRPVTGLDFSSLYPSLIMAYNLSPEKIILNPEEADIMRRKGNELHKIEFQFNKRTLRAWSIRHNNHSENKGLYPVILEDLFNKRVALKLKLASLGKKKERLKKLISLLKEKKKKISDSLNSEYSSICFDYNCLNSKQTALKVYMNTFYGETGNSKSPFFLRELAGGITSAGQYNINLVADFVRKKGFEIKYGDTDSLYLTGPKEYYEKCDNAYNSGKGTISKLEYWTEMVRITMDMMKKIRCEVNTYLKMKNGTNYLKMAYEEVLFPVCFVGKKKYFGVPHENIINFKPDNLFIKGIDTVKQGQSQLFKYIGEQIMWKAIDIENTRPLHEIVEDVLRDAKSKEWNFDKFIETDRWKPTVKNLCVHHFIERMKEKYKNKIPDPGERFTYVVVKGDPYYNNGRKIPWKKANYMEFPDVAKELNKEIDINYYLESTIGLCARFINEDEKYQPSSSDNIMQIKDKDQREKRIDDYSQKEAKKWLIKYIKQLRLT